LAASEYVVGTGLRWTAGVALAGLSEADIDRLPTAIANAQAAFHCDIEWLANRLTVLWLAAGYRKGEAQATAWLGETIRLLSHVPTDIISAAIDQAVVQSERGFIPTVGEILKIASPALEKRRQALSRLEVMIAAASALPAKASDPEPVCTPEEAAEILSDVGMASVVRAMDPVAQTPPAEPTLDDYIALGLTEIEARSAMEQRRRLLSRGRATPIGDAADTAMNQVADALRREEAA
jgi:ketosteroid isomerase-like protein